MLPLRHARFWRLADLVLLGLVFMAALMPAVWFWNDTTNALIWFKNADKWLHGTTFLVLAVWFAGQYRRPAYWRIAVGLILFGLLIEGCQFIVGYRSADWLDMGANAGGILAGLALAMAGIGGWCLRVEGWYSTRKTGSAIE